MGYDANSNLQRTGCANNTEDHTSYDYDAAGQLLHLVNDAPGGAVNSRFNFTYNSLEERTAMAAYQPR